MVLRMGYKGTDGNGYVDMSYAAQAFNYIALMKSRGVNVAAVNCSWGSSNTGGMAAATDALIAQDVLVVVFTCNHCPYARAGWPLILNLHKKYQDKVGFVAINPNDENVYPDDSFENMKKYAKEWGITFPYLRDETQQVARAYDAQCTPDVYMFGKDRKLVYRGRINDNWQDPSKVSRHDLDDALFAVASGKEVLKEQFPSMGCSIKWKQ